MYSQVKKWSDYVFEWSANSMPNETTFSNHYYLLSFLCWSRVRVVSMINTVYVTPGRNLPFLESPVVIFPSIVHTICTGVDQVDWSTYGNAVTDSLCRLFQSRISVVHWIRLVRQNRRVGGDKFPSQRTTVSSDHHCWAHRVVSAKTIQFDANSFDNSSKSYDAPNRRHRSLEHRTGSFRVHARRNTGATRLELLTSLEVSLVWKTIKTYLRQSPRKRLQSAL